MDPVDGVVTVNLTWAPRYAGTSSEIGPAAARFHGCKESVRSGYRGQTTLPRHTRDSKGGCQPGAEDAGSSATSNGTDALTRGLNGA